MQGHRCGSKIVDGSKGEAYLENTVIVQHTPGIQVDYMIRFQCFHIRVRALLKFFRNLLGDYNALIFIPGRNGHCQSSPVPF